jgi:hypothetical protein
LLTINTTVLQHAAVISVIEQQLICCTLGSEHTANWTFAAGSAMQLRHDKTHLLFIISSYHMPLYSVHTMMSPASSLVVSLLNALFHVAHTTALLWPSRVWFCAKALLPPAAAAAAAFCVSFCVAPSSRSTCRASHQLVCDHHGSR